MQARARPNTSSSPPATPFGTWCCCLWSILIVAFVAGYIPRHRRELQLVAEADTHNEALPQVSVMTARRAEGRGNLVLPGNIQAVTEAPILARAEGFLKTRYVDIGDRVTAGQLLAEIEAPDMDQQVRQAQAAVQQVAGRSGTRHRGSRARQGQ